MNTNTAMEPIEGTYKKGLGQKYTACGGRFVVIPIRGHVRFAGVGQRLRSFVEWYAVDVTNDDPGYAATARSLDEMAKKLEKLTHV